MGGYFRGLPAPYNFPACNPAPGYHSAGKSDLSTGGGG